MTKRQATPAEPGRSFEIEVATLRAALKDVAGAVEARNTIPVLSNLLFVVTPTSLTITGTDLDVQIARHVQLARADAFSTTVEAATIGRIADKLPADASALVQYGDGKVTITAGRSRFSLWTLPVDDFPTMDLPVTTADFTLPAITLGAAIDTVAHAISTEEVRYYLNGVFVHVPDSGDLRLATTDGHRLARVVLPRPDGAETLPDAIIPRKIVKLLSTLLARHEGEVEIGMTDRMIRIGLGATTLVGKLIDGTFPDYTRVVPTANTGRLAIDREVLIAAVARVITVSSDKTRAVKLDLARDRLMLTVSSPEKGQATEELPCDWPAAPLTIGFNSRFLLDTLGHLTADTVEAMLGDSAAPTLWRDREDAASIFVIMPMRV